MTKKLMPPEKFLQSFQQDFGSDFLREYLSKFDESGERGLRVNTLKISPHEFENISNLPLEKIEFFDGAYYLNTSNKLGNSVLHQAGAFYLQEPSSMIPVASVQDLGFQNKTILDLCASPGGKSTQIACLMHGTGLLVSNEIDSKRAETLFSNIERLGITNAVILNETPQNLSKNLSNKFDMIFVDAPCSGEGMFRKDETAILEWNENLKFYNHDRQLEILLEANKMLKQNGILVYSTCTFNTLENETTVHEFSTGFGYEILNVNTKIEPFTHAGLPLFDNIDLMKTRHFFPFSSRGEGQYVAVLKKISPNENMSKTPKKPQSFSVISSLTADYKILSEFVSKALQNFDLANFNIVKIGQKYFLVNKNVEVNCFDRLKIKSLGVMFGEIIKNRFEPAHQFFKAFGEYFANKINIKSDSDILKKYLKGEQLSLDEILTSHDTLSTQIVSNAYGVIFASGVSLGGVKVVDNMLKNHYPKGLRINNII